MRDPMKLIRRDPKACYGCRFCELSCSFHKQGALAPGGGAIKVSKDHRSGIIHWSIDSTCDMCKGIERPLCLKYCTYGALTLTEGKK